MNNVITILVDSVFSKCLGNQRTKLSSTPFIDKLIKSASYYPNVYSFGPYTDAATKGLYCIEPTLSNYGYYYGVNSSNNNHYRVFKEHGYETYGFYYPYYLVSSKVEQYIDHSIYTSGFLFQSVWFGKLEFYSDIQKKRKLTEKEYFLITKCVEMVFDCWNLFYKNIQSDESSVIVQRLKTVSSANTGWSGLKSEINKFNENPHKYIDDLLRQGMNHSLARINEFDFSKNVDQVFLQKKIFEENRDFFNQLKQISVLNAIKDPEISITEVLEELLKTVKTHDKEHLRYIINYGMYLFAYNYFRKQSSGEKWQLMASMNKQVETLCSMMAERKSEAPFYASLHVLEPHHSISFFSYDSDNSDTIKEEISYLYPLLKNGASNKCGNILYQLSLRYVDLCIKRLFANLKKMGILDKTTVMIVADHGSSYTGKNIRSSVTNNFHIENYNVPLVIWQSKMEKTFIGKHSGFFTSADVFPILWNTIGLDVDMSKYPYSTNDPHKPREYVITEYMGPGCPDMLSRDVWIAARSNDYVIGYKANIKKVLDIDNPTVIFNCKKDTNERKNLVGVIIPSKEKALQTLTVAIENRFEIIKKESSDILNNLSGFSVVKTERE